MKFQVGADIKGTITSTNHDGRKTRKWDVRGGSQGPFSIINMRGFSDGLKFRFYQPFNYSRMGLTNTVKVKPIRGGFNVEVHWSSHPSDIVVSADYFPWVGKDKKPLSDKNLKDLIGLVKKWNMSQHWYYES